MGRSSDARERLLAATTELLWLGSYGGVSVDDICARAGVKKGSFYHFFPSKDVLVIAALDAEWQQRKRQLDALFSPSVPPLERLRGYFASVHARQAGFRRRYGQVVGGVFSKLGLEVGSDSEIGRKVQEILSMYLKYLESALRDAVADGASIDDVAGKARALFAFMEGVLGQARIQNDLKIIEEAEAPAFALLGLSAPPRRKRRRRRRGILDWLVH